MTQLLFEQLKQHAGPAHWPTDLRDLSQQPDEPAVRLALPIQRSQNLA